MKPLPWQQSLWQQALAQHAQGRLPQALLLAGPRGVGKDRFVRGLTAFLLCEDPERRPCGTCRSCAQLAAGTHPDALLLSNEGLHCLAAPQGAAQGGAIPLWTPDRDSKKRDIGVEGIRKLIERLGLSRHAGGGRVAVVSPADALNISGANMLLKTVEEPPAGTQLVLVAERWRELPATLRSRCQIWRLPAPAARDGLDWLRKAHPGQPAAALAPFARSPLLAAAALDAELLQRREQWNKALADPQASSRWPGLKREDARYGLECWLELAAGWLRQRLDSRAPPGIPIPASLDAPGLTRLLDRIQAGMRGIERNGNPALIMESIIIRSTGQTQKGEQWLDPAARNPEF